MNVPFKNKTSLTMPGISATKLSIPLHNPGSNYWMPQKPTGLGLTVISDTEIQLDWTNVDTSGDGVSIERSIDGINYIEITTVALGVNSYSDTGLTEGTQYFYRIRSYYGINYSGYSNIENEVTSIIALLEDGNTFARYTPKTVDGTLNVAGVESIWWDMTVGSSTLGAEQSSGVIVLYGVYIITAAQANFFFAGCAVGNTFVCGTVKTCDANNKVQRYLGNHATQHTAAKRPINSLFDGTQFLKTAPFAQNQPYTVYLVIKPLTYQTGDKIIDGLTSDSNGMVFVTANSYVTIYAPTYATINRVAQFEIGSWSIIRAKYAGINSKLQINKSPTIGSWNAGANNLGGITICATGAGNTNFLNAEVAEIIYRAGVDSDEDYATIQRYLESYYFKPIITPVWEAQGTVMEGTVAFEGSKNIFEPNVIYEGNAQILETTGNVFKMWYTGGWALPGIYYAESLDGLAWTKHNAILLADHRCSTIIKVGSTYYLYTPKTDLSEIDLYTSTDGITLTLPNEGVIVKDGGTGWDNGAVANVAIIIEDGTWHMFYEGRTGTASWFIGHATSADGIAWTKQTSPVLPSAVVSRGGPDVKKVGSTFYMWCHGCESSVSSLPTDVFRYKSNDLITWTKDVRDMAYWRATADEGAATTVGQIADVFLIEVNSKVYMFHAASSDGRNEAGEMRIKLVTADMTMADLVLTQEGRII